MFGKICVHSYLLDDIHEKEKTEKNTIIIIEQVDSLFNRYSNVIYVLFINANHPPFVIIEFETFFSVFIDATFMYITNNNTEIVYQS